MVAKMTKRHQSVARKVTYRVAGTCVMCGCFLLDVADGEVEDGDGRLFLRELWKLWKFGDNDVDDS